MSSLIENLEEAARVNVALTELIREAHSTIKALRKTERDVKKELQDIVDRFTSDNIKPELEKMLPEIQESLERMAEHVMSEFDKVAKPLMQSIELIDEAGKKGTFFDRG